MSDPRLLRPSEVLAKTQLGRMTVWRLEKAGKFPRRRQISPGRIGWLASEIDKWIESRAFAGESK